MQNKPILPIILGPTASGKTALATAVAYKLQYEIISADSRQVYKGMTIGTGKDLSEYTVQGVQIPYHLIDIVEAGYMYNLFEFSQDFARAYTDILQRNKQALVCGGTGLYLESIIKQYTMVKVPEDADFRAACELRSFDDLKQEFLQYKTPHNVTDFDTKKRLIRAIEIARYEHHHAPQKNEATLKYEPLVMGIAISRETRRNRIEARLHNRIHQGLIDEVEALIESGITHQILQYYGLEYKYASLYILGELSKELFEKKLCTAIFQFAKRQMTWFRGMERRGIHVHWIDGECALPKQVKSVVECISKHHTAAQ